MAGASSVSPHLKRMYAFMWLSGRWCATWRIVQACHRAAEIRRRRGDLLDASLPLGVRQRRDRSELADRIALVAHWSTRHGVVSSVVPHLMRNVPRRFAYP